MSPDGFVHVLKAGISRFGRQAFPAPVQAHLFVQLHGEFLPPGESREVQISYEVRQDDQEKPVAEVRGALVQGSEDRPFEPGEEAALALAMPVAFVAPAVGLYRLVFFVDGDPQQEIPFVVHAIDADLQPVRPAP